ncbi:hypothetical protein [Phycicoccus sonneratiae]|uniref:Uncharacterized protein n=1 Tax=Phycicoccus sonneratiae TaxID=2807628 RepID=A0ABS2CKL2_9MICO|nr:hypothetical protein [Phycicoccus sonneraticus]MBM6400373.1 hypothetical protein [Phycicoccus sonneraticus]
MPDDVLDLLVHAPEPPMSVDADRVVAGARRSRRGRRVLVGAAALTSAALVAAGATLLPDLRPGTALTPAGPTPPRVGPAPVSPTTTEPATSPPDGEQVWGTAQVMSQQRDRKGNRPVLYLTPDRWLCVGTIEDSGQVHPSSCRPAQAPVDDAFSTGQAWSLLGNLPAGVEAREYAVGLVPADITRVEVRTEDGPATAHLVPAPDPDLGQLYWADTPAVTDTTDPAGRSRVAYRGAAEVFSCDYDACVIEQGTPATDEPG